MIPGDRVWGHHHGRPFGGVARKIYPTGLVMVWVDRANEWGREVITVAAGDVNVDRRNEPREDELV